MQISCSWSPCDGDMAWADDVALLRVLTALSTFLDGRPGPALVQCITPLSPGMPVSTSPASHESCPPADGAAAVVADSAEAPGAQAEAG